MWRETNLFGIYMSPLIVYMLAAGVIFAPVRLLLGRLRAFRWAWHPTLVAGGIYFCLLGMLVAWF